MDLSERYEQLIAYLTTHLPTPVSQEEHESGLLVFVGGTPGEVVATLSGSHVVIDEYAISFDGPHAPAVRPRRVGTVNWRRLPESVLMNVVGQLIKGAREVRLSRYRTCHFCGKTKPPEYLHDDDVCAACAESEVGAVH
jgi:hypothetical protein